MIFIEICAIFVAIFYFLKIKELWVEPKAETWATICLIGASVGFQEWSHPLDWHCCSSSSSWASSPIGWSESRADLR